MDAISSVAAIEPAFLAPLQPIEGMAGHANAAPGFAALMDQAVGKVNNDVSVAETSLQQLASGQPVELHDVMISLEQARIGVQTIIQIRNRMVEAYQDLMRMQI